MAPDDKAYQRGVRFLLNTQRADGSWFVASRSPRIQAYFEGGFPYGHDQWISEWGTAWAAMALAKAIQPPGEAVTFGTSAGKTTPEGSVANKVSGR